MSHSTSIPALHSLLNDNLSIQNRITALKQVKHDIIGHDLKKEEAIRCGIVPVLVQGLKDSTSSIASRKRKAQDGNGSRHRASSREGSWDHLDELRLQCCFVAASLARVGSPFASALIDGGILPPLLVSCNPSVVASRITTETLRTIKVFAQVLGLSARVQPRPACASLCRELYSFSMLGNFAAILARSIDRPGAGEQAILVSQIISETLKDAAYQAMVVRAGILELLASRLASHMRTPSQPAIPTYSSDLTNAFNRKALAPLLYALTCVIGTSFYRTARLLYADDVRIDSLTYPNSNEASNSAGLEQTESSTDTLDALLPRLQAVESRADHQSRNFPSLVSSTTTGFQPLTPSLVATSRTIGMGDYGSPIVAWLVHLSRVCEKTDRLATLWLLVHILKNVHVSAIDGFSDAGNRDRSLAILIVPLLVRMLDDAVPKPGDKALSDTELEYKRLAREKAPRALARLIEHHKDLQKAAVEAGAIKIVSQLLKKSFDPVSETAKKRMWNPTPSSFVTASQGIHPLTQAPDFCAEQVHRLQTRAAALECLAALAQKEDANRKIVIESGVLQCVVESLVPLSSTESIDFTTQGNPAMVLTRACQLTTVLSRSVSILRTSLIDGGVLKPIFNLISHPGMGVKLAATAVVTNFLLQFSPMREDLIKAGVIDILCAHSRSNDMELAQGSLWALKHLLNSCSDDIKMEVLTKLGPDWLLKAMGADLEITNVTDGDATEGQGDSSSLDGKTMMESGDTTQDEDDDLDGDDTVMSDKSEFRATNHSLSDKEIIARLRAIRRAETDKAREALKDMSRMQMQALDVTRNLISEANPTQGVMVEHILNQFGTERLFANLERNISLRAASPSASDLNSPSSVMSPGAGAPTVPSRYHGHFSSTTMPPPPVHSPSDRNSHKPPIPQTNPEVLISTLFILIHIANGKPAHRRLMISQTSLMRLILPLFSHPDSRIRTGCCWIIHNLCWQEDSSDAVSLRGRVADLRALGVEDAVLRMAKDHAVDTRERARQIVDVFGRFPDESLSGGERRGMNFASTREGIAGGARAWEGR